MIWRSTEMSTFLPLVTVWDKTVTDNSEHLAVSTFEISLVLFPEAQMFNASLFHLHLPQATVSLEKVAVATKGCILKLKIWELNIRGREERSMHMQIYYILRPLSVCSSYHILQNNVRFIEKQAYSYPELFKFWICRLRLWAKSFGFRIEGHTQFLPGKK